MQQKFCSRGSGSFLLEGGGPSCGGELPFRCPRCGERRRFGSLSSLRGHLERRHAPPPPGAAPAGFSITGQLPQQLMASALWPDASLPPPRRPPHARSLSDSRDGGPLHAAARRRTHSVGVGTQDQDQEEDQEEEEEEEEEEDQDQDQDQEEDQEEEDGGSEDGDGAGNEEEPETGPQQANSPPQDQNQNQNQLLELVEQGSYSGVETAAASAAVRRRLAGVLRAADGSMQRRLAGVSTALAQADTELLCERAHRQQLARQRQQVLEREQALSRQVDVAAMVIAALRQQISASQSELERREREVLTIQSFLEAAARQETSGKVRIQNFIESLLRRIAMAERLLEFYQAGATPRPRQQHQQQTDNGPHRMSKSRSAGGQLFAPPPADCRAPPQPAGERERRERLEQSSRLFCRPEQRDDIWGRQGRRAAAHEA